jgi:hypothetical protein
MLSAYIRPLPAAPNLIAVPEAMIVGAPGSIPSVFEHVPMDTFLNRRTIFVISFDDALDHEFSVEAPLKPVNDNEITCFPGLKMEIIPQ